MTDIQIPSLSSVPETPTKPRSANVSTFDALAINCPHYISPEAEIAVVAEAPSLAEITQGMPFVGPAGKQFNRVIIGSNLDQSKISKYHVCQTQLPYNKTAYLYKTNNTGAITYMHPDWHELRSRLLQELAESSAKVIMPLGGTALLALSGDLNTHKITKYRGSCYHASDIGLDILGDKYILPSYHPSMYEARKSPKLYYVALRDMAKALDVARNGLPKVELNLTIGTEFDSTIAYLQEIQPGMETSFDIECSQRGLQCLGFTKGTPNEAITIPFWGPNGNIWSEQEELHIMQEIARILEHPDIPLIMQNGMFDIYWMLTRYGIKTDNYYFDTMLAHHLCYTDLPKGLDFLTSFYTYFPYYKDEGKMWNKLGVDYNMFWEYNGKDVMYTHLIKNQLMCELDYLNIWDYFQDHVMSLHKPLLEMQYYGLKVDLDGLAKARADVNNEIEALMVKTEDIIEARTGNRRRINPKSTKQMQEYFYGELGIKPYINKKTKRPRLDQDALTRIARKDYEEAKIFAKISLLRTERDTFYSAKTSSDGFMRCNYNISGTESGRLSSSTNIYNEGLNLQNQPLYMKRFYIVERNGFPMIFIESDYAQAESWIVAFVSQDLNMIDTMTAGVDVHTLNASKIFQVPYEEVTKQMRKDGKRTGHASNYMMGPMTFAMQNDIPFNVAKERLNAYKEAYPQLPIWWETIRQQLSSTRMLYNLYGRPRRFLGLLNDDLHRTGVSFIPQSTVGDLMNQSIIKLANKPRPVSFTMRTQVHDSTKTALKVKGVDDVVTMMQHMTNCMYHEFSVHGRSFVIPNDFKMGNSWGHAPELGRYFVDVKTIDRDEIAAKMEEIGYTP